MATPLEHHTLLQTRNRAAQVGHELWSATREVVDDIAVTNDVQRWHADPGARPGSGQLPVAVDVAVPVQAASEAGELELARVEIDVGVTDPVG